MVHVVGSSGEDMMHHSDLVGLFKSSKTASPLFCHAFENRHRSVIKSGSKALRLSKHREPQASRKAGQKLRNELLAPQTQWVLCGEKTPDATWLEPSKPTAMEG
jgi:hypothetical protein